MVSRTDAGPEMALQSRINEIYPNRKPFMEPVDLKRRAAGKDLRVQALLGAQEAAKRQCIDGLLPQEQQPPVQEAMQQQDDHSNHAGAPTDFSAFYRQREKEGQLSCRGSGAVLQESPQQNMPAVEPLQQQQLHDHHHLHHQQQQQHEGLEAFSSGWVGQDLQQQQHGALSTLDRLMTDNDLGSRHKPPDRELQTMQSLHRVFGGDNSRDGFMRGQHEAAGANRSNSSASAAGAAAAAATAAAREQHSWHLSQLPHIPWDSSVKSSARFSSPQPFNVLQPDQGLNSRCQGAAAAAAGQASPQERLQQALVQWQYPAAPLPQALLQARSSTAAAAGAAAAAGGASAAAASAAERGRSDPAVLLLQERVQQWREALRAAYLALRHGSCPVVYVCGQAFKQPFTAVLCAPGVMGPTDSSSTSSSRFTAVLSRSNRLLRGHLALYGCEAAVTGQLEQQQQQQAAVQQQGKQQPQQQQSAAAFDGQPGSQMLLVGVQRVHGLYAALLALPWCEASQPDVPLLYAPVPFLHAQLCPLRLVALPDAVLEQQQQQHQQQQRGAGAEVCGVPQPLHYVELRAPGAIMPWTLHRVLGVLQDSQGWEGFQAFLGTEPCSSSLNMLQEHWAAAAAAAGGGGSGSGQQQWRLQASGGLSGAEVECWAGSAALLHGRALRQLKLEEGCIAAKLA